MRKLQTSDIFNTLRLIKKANLKEEIKPILQMASEGDLNVKEVGINGILGVLEILSEKKAEHAIYEVLAGPFEITPEQVEQMDILTLTENIETLIGENDLKRFFTLLAGMNSKK